MLVAGSIYEACRYFELFRKTPLKEKCAVVTSYNPMAGDVSKEDTGADSETDKQFIFNTYTELLENVTAKPGKSKTETYEDEAKRQEVLMAWYRDQLREAAPPLISRWETLLGVKVKKFFIRHMKTKWGSCNHRDKHILLNSELAKKPRNLLEYVVVHEMVHLLEPTHNERFLTILGKHYPAWRAARAELNELPLAAETWRE
jgi:predicted metal-dependent hydrolase